MDSVKIGKFIKECRKEKGITQKELAEFLMISDKTVSKWETGNGMPEVSLMVPLSNMLCISVNELLSGERLEGDEYRKKAEENIVKIMKEKNEERKKFILVNTLAFMFCIACVPIFIVAGLLEIETFVRIVLVVGGLIFLAVGLVMFCEIDRKIGYFECKNCGHKFEPTLGAYIMGMHTIRKRYLKCPNCKKSTWCTRCMSKDE